MCSIINVRTTFDYLNFSIVGKYFNRKRKKNIYGFIPNLMNNFVENIFHDFKIYFYHTKILLKILNFLTIFLINNNGEVLWKNVNINISIV